MASIVIAKIIISLPYLVDLSVVAGRTTKGIKLFDVYSMPMQSGNKQSLFLEIFKVKLYTMNVTRK